MRIIRNERRIRLLRTIGRYVPWLALLALAAALVISYVRPQWLGVMAVGLVIGVILSFVGGRTAERYAGPLAHHEALATALKGMDKRHVLVQYLLPAPHVLFDPGGCTVLMVKTHTGAVTFEDGRFKHSQRGRIFRQLAGQEGIALAHEEAQALADKVAQWLERNVEGVAVPTRAAIVFVSPKAKVDAKDSPVPAFYGKKVKAWLRGPGQRKALAPADYRTLVAAVEALGPAAEDDTTESGDNEED
jgi:hypothetical protein